MIIFRISNGWFCTIASHFGAAEGYAYRIGSYSRWIRSEIRQFCRIGSV